MEMAGSKAGTCTTTEDTNGVIFELFSGEKVKRINYYELLDRI